MGANQTCPNGRDITTEERCEETVKYASAIMNDVLEINDFRYPPSTSPYSKTSPLHCSIRATGERRGRVVFNQNVNTTNSRFFNGQNLMLCESGKHKEKFNL